MRAARRASRRLGILTVTLAAAGSAGCLSLTRPDGGVAGPVRIPGTPAVRDSTVLGAGFGAPGPATLPGELQLAAETVVLAKEIGTSEGAGTPGETLFGFLLPLRLRWRPDEQVVIEAGALLERAFGNGGGDGDELDGARPLLRLIYEPWPERRIVAGTIFPTHAAHEALLDDTARLRADPEEGLQLRVDGERFQHDSWIDWDLREEADAREQFDVGSVSRFTLGGWRLEGQLVVHHAGGQRNSVGGVENVVTLAAGSSLGFGLPCGPTLADGRRLAGELRPGLYAFFNEEETDARDSDGHGYEARLDVALPLAEGRWLFPYLSHWESEDFFPHAGDPLYGLDRHTRVGVDGLFELAGGLRVSAGGELVFEDGELGYVLSVAFGWSGAAPLSFGSPSGRGE